MEFGKYTLNYFGSWIYSKIFISDYKECFDISGISIEIVPINFYKIGLLIKNKEKIKIYTLFL